MLIVMNCWWRSSYAAVSSSSDASASGAAMFVAEPESIPLRNWNLLPIPNPISGIGIELELPSLELELNWNCHHWNMN